MTTAQWMMEYHALRAREEAQVNMVTAVFKGAVRALRSLFISVLGLHYTPKPVEGEEVSEAARDDDGIAIPTYMPLSYIVGRPEMLEVLRKNYQDAEGAEQALADTTFDQFSARLAAGDMSDLEPVLEALPDMDRDGEFDLAAHHALLESMGIKIVKTED